MVDYSQEELLAKWEEFFEEQEYHSRILSLADEYPETRSLEVRFEDLDRYDTDFGMYLLRRPQTAIAAGEETIRRLIPPTDEAVRVHLRMKGLPRESRVQIRDLRSKHLGTYIAVEGLVRKATEVRPKLTDASFRCARCGTVIKMPQENTVLHEPLECYEDQGGCKRSASATKFALMNEGSVFLDTQQIEAQEAPEGLRGGEEPRRLSAHIDDDMVGFAMPGDRVVLNGILRSYQRVKPGLKSTLFDIFMEINSMEMEQVEYEEIKISDEDVEEIRREAEDPDIFRHIVASIAPSIYGLEVEKEALSLQLFGGVPKHMPDGRRIRGDIHILLVGDPGTAKSELLAYMAKLSPRGILATGRAASAAGLTAAAIRSEEFGEGRWTLEAGALVLADKGLACLHPSAEVMIDGVPRAIESLFDATKSWNATSRGRNLEIMALESETPTLDLHTLHARNSRIKLLARRRYSGPILRVKLDSGFVLRLTPDHVVLDGEDLEWKQLQDVRARGRLVALQRLPERSEPIYILDIIPSSWIVQLTTGQKQELRSSLYAKFPSLAAANRYFGLSRDFLSGRSGVRVGQFRKILEDLDLHKVWKGRPLAFGRSSSTERLKVGTITPELAYILGFIFGDGHVSVDNRHSSVSIFQSRSNLRNIQQVLRATKAVSSRTWGMHGRLMRSQIRGHPVVSACYHMHRGSNLIAYLYKWLTDENLANLLHLDDASLRGFIAGAMDSDGCVSIKKSRKDATTYESVDVEFLVSSNEETNLRFMLALRRFDIYSRLRQGRGVLRIQITSSHDARRLMSCISPYSAKYKMIPERKRGVSPRHEEVPTQPLLQILREMDPRPGQLLEKGVWSAFYDLTHSRRKPFKDQLMRLSEALTPWSTEEQRMRIQALTASDYAVERIAEVTVEHHDGYVYDLRVPEGENFLCDGVIVHNCIDEMDKMNPQDRSAIHEAMEQQRVSVAKAGITAVLQARCAVLGAANPKFGRFDEHKYVSEQIDMPPTLLSRFDIIFSMFDRPQAEYDRNLADHIIRGHLAGEMITKREHGESVPASGVSDDAFRPFFKPDFFRKYVAFAKRVYPILSPEAMDTLKEQYLDIRKGGEMEGSAVPITPRQLEAYVRLAEASARARLSPIVSADDAARAVRIVEYWLSRVSGEGGRVDIDIITTGVSHSQREQMIVLRDILRELAGEDGTADLEDIVQLAEQRGIPVAQAEKILKRWKEEGEVYTPTEGKFRVVTRL